MAKRKRKLYKSMTLCPDSDVGHRALHDAIQYGWEPLVAWTEVVDGQPHSSRIALRRKVKPDGR